MQPENNSNNHDPLNDRLDKKLAFAAAVEAVTAKPTRKAWAATLTAVPFCAGIFGIGWAHGPWYLGLMLTVFGGWTVYLVLKTNGRSKSNRGKSPPQSGHPPEGEGPTQRPGGKD